MIVVTALCVLRCSCCETERGIPWACFRNPERCLLFVDRFMTEHEECTEYENDRRRARAEFTTRKMREMICAQLARIERNQRLAARDKGHGTGNTGIRAVH